MEREVANKIADLVNGMVFDPIKVGDSLANDTHRTLQQNFMKVCLAFIRSEAKNVGEYDHDLRNEGTVKLCAHIVKLLDGDLIALPLI